MDALIGYMVLSIPVLLVAFLGWLGFGCRRRWARIACWAAAVLIAAVSLLMCWLVRGAFIGKEHHVVTLACGQERSIRISTPYWSEPGRLLLYQPRQGGTDLLPNECYFGSTWRPPEELCFGVMTSADGSIVAVIEQTNPHVVLLVHDFLKGWSWPASWGLPPEENYRQAVAMIGVLNAEDASRHLELFQSVSGHGLIGAAR